MIILIILVTLIFDGGDISLVTLFFDEDEALFTLFFDGGDISLVTLFFDEDEALFTLFFDGGDITFVTHFYDGCKAHFINNFWDGTSSSERKRSIKNICCFFIDVLLDCWLNNTHPIFILLNIHYLVFAPFASVIVLLAYQQHFLSYC